MNTVSIHYSKYTFCIQYQQYHFSKRMIATSNVNENDGSIAPVAVAAAAAASITTTAASVRLWLAAEADRVKALSKWNELTHHNVECGRCGCNCTEGECGGIPIRTDFRWEKKDQENLYWPDDRIDVPGGLGYKMSGNTMLKINRFCEPCFELLVEKSILQRDGYERVKGQTLFDIVTEEMIEATTERANDKHRVKKSRHRDDVYYTPFFDSGSELSWQAMNKDVDPDDIAIVVANSLIQEGCRTRYLQLDGIHYNDPGFGQKGYKALALALSINTVVERIDFYHDRGEGCCCDIGTSYAEDISNGLFLKALQHNRVSALKELPPSLSTSLRSSYMGSLEESQTKPRVRTGIFS